MSIDLDYCRYKIFRRARLAKNGCIESTYRSGGRYAQMKVNGKMVSVHRISWMVHFGDIPKGYNILHKCDNPKCFNPEHLFLGTLKDNSKDMQVKGRDNYQGARKYDKSIEDLAISLRKDGKTYCEIGKILEIPISTINSIFMKKENKHKVNYGISKYSKETIECALELRRKGILCKEIQKILKIPKRSLTRIFKRNIN